MISFIHIINSTAFKNLSARKQF